MVAQCLQDEVHFGGLRARPASGTTVLNHAIKALGGGKIFAVSEKNLMLSHFCPWLRLSPCQNWPPYPSPSFLSLRAHL